MKHINSKQKQAHRRHQRGSGSKRTGVKTARVQQKKQQHDSASASSSSSSSSKRATRITNARNARNADSTAPAPPVGSPRGAAVSKTPVSFDEKQRGFEKQLAGAKFRWLNEKLYTMSGSQALDMFRDDPSLMEDYHDGYMSQLADWPEDPLQNIVNKICKMPHWQSFVVADFGCGDARLARQLTDLTTKTNSPPEPDAQDNDELPNSNSNSKSKKPKKKKKDPHSLKVHSFDLVALNDLVTVCDISQVPLSDNTVDVAVFCLSLMSTNFMDFIREAHRVLRQNGTLLIAEVSSRFENISKFVACTENVGFSCQLKHHLGENQYFMIFVFHKQEPPTQKKSSSCPYSKADLISGEGTLKACIYKRR